MIFDVLIDLNDNVESRRYVEMEMEQKERKILFDCKD